MKLIATCPDYAKARLAEELKSLGATKTTERYRAVHFQTNDEGFYRVHLHTRLASQIILVVREAAASNRNIMFSQAKRVNWPKYLRPKSHYMIDVTYGDRRSEKHTFNEISYLLRNAIDAVFKVKEVAGPSARPKTAPVTITCHLEKGRMTLGIQTSGKSLHKRGYRGPGHPAPIKETTAAFLLREIGFDGSQPFWDPMCGSGTIGIEAAMIALNKASQIHRKKNDFAFEHLGIFDNSTWRELQEQSRSERRPHCQHPVRVSDIDPKYVEMARTNGLKARVERYMEFGAGSIFDVEPDGSPGIIVSNLPYGKRINPSDAKNYGAGLGNFYDALGKKLKESFSGWRVGLVVGAETEHRALRLKPDRAITFKNGSEPVKFLVFSMR